MRCLAPFLVALLAIGAGCGESRAPAADPAPRVEDDAVVFPEKSPQLAAIVTHAAEVRRAAVVQLPGRLVWDEERTARLYPAFAGRVVRIDAKPGDVVQPGQRLAQLASADFGQVQVDARKSAADLALAEKNVARVRELVANDVAPTKDLQSADAELLRARAEHTRALERVRVYGGGDAVDSTFTVRSPIAGVVVERNINPGQELRPESATANMPAMFVVTDPARLWVHLDATERDLELLKVGRTVTFKSNAYPGETFEARIDLVSDFLDPQSRTLKVRGSAANADRRLKGEMYVVAKLEVPVRPGVSVPAKAVFLIGNRQYVFVEDSPGRFRRVEVQAEGEDAGLVPITAGAAVGQRIVVDGNLFLQQMLAAKAKP